MLSNAISGQCNLLTGREILYHIASRVALFRTDCDHKRDLHFVGLANLVTDALAREIDSHRDILSTKVLREAHCMHRGLRLNDAYHELGSGRVRGQEIVGLEKIASRDVAHRETDGRNRSAAEHAQ